MIPHDHITEWRAHAPWVQDFQVEQNIGGKLLDARFNADIGPLLATGFSWNAQDAMENIRSRLIARLPE